MRISDWSSDVCSSDLSLARRTDARLEGAVDAEAPEDEGGPQQQRTPEIADEPPAPAEPPRQIDALGLEQDDADPATDKRAIDRSRNSQGDVQRAHALNQGQGYDADTLPSFGSWAAARKTRCGTHHSCPEKPVSSFKTTAPTPAP